MFPHEKPVSSIEEAQQKSRTRFFWIVDYLCDYSEFDFLYEPPPWEAGFRHVWPSQWQIDSGTYLIPKNGYTESKYRDFIVRRQSSAAPALIIEQMNAGNQTILTVKNKIEIISTGRYISDYLGTFRRIIPKLKDKTEYLWILSDLCDYSNFDFSWHPDPWQKEMLHVFSSNEQKFGDTFLVHVPSFLEKIDQCEILEWFDTIHFVKDISVKRIAPTVVNYSTDTLSETIKQYRFDQPVVVFDRYGLLNDQPPTISLWQKNTKNVVQLSSGAGTAVVPKEVKNYFNEQVYDYPYIIKNSVLLEDPESDVIFISNGEKIAEENWEHLKRICPRAKRCDGITGRTAAYNAAAQMSNTPWFFAVFAKTEVLESFKFDFQPDRFQEPKHYIFHSRNPLNGLKYGSMNIDLYNKQLVFDTVPGIDFTLSQKHTVIPICASVSRFNTDPWVTWRSAFREVLKLNLEVDQGAGPEIQYRLHKWCTVAEGENAEHCLRGAADALEYYESVNGNYDKLMLSFDWQWLHDWYFSKYQHKLWLEPV